MTVANGEEVKSKQLSYEKYQSSKLSQCGTSKNELYQDGMEKAELSYNTRFFL